MRRATWCQVRRATGDWLHKMGMRLQRLGCEGDLTAGQERLFDQIIAELEWRSARTRRGYKRCHCELCSSPFPTVEVEF